MEICFLLLLLLLLMKQNTNPTELLLRKLLAEKVLFLDGAMGTMIQKYNLTEQDFVVLEEQKKKYAKHMNDFREKYATDELLWEFQSLSMFITNNPLEEAYQLIGTEWNDVPNGDKAVVPCVIVDIKRKKTKKKKFFLNLFIFYKKKIRIIINLLILIYVLIIKLWNQLYGANNSKNTRN